MSEPTAPSAVAETRSAVADARRSRLVVRDVVKEFPGVRAVDGVSMDVLAGEIHALIGENGAGKSTLMHLVAGVYPPDRGTIELDGVSIAGLDEHGSAEAGVAMVYQERSLVGALSVAENVFAGRQPIGRLRFIDRATMEQRTADILRGLEVDIDPGRMVADLSPGQQQMVEIAKGLSHDVKVLILDEPTAALTIGEARHLFRVVRQLASRGIATVYVSHRLAEVFELADRVTVMRDGRVTGVRDTKTTTTRELISLMVGRELSFDPDPRRVPSDAQVALTVRSLQAEGVRDVSFDVRYGEIVCLAGLIGAGRTEACEAIFGARTITGGTVEVAGHEVRPRSPRDAMRAGISMLPEDRKESGLFIEFDITANIAAASLPELTSRGVLSDARAEELATEYVGQLRVATPTVKREVRNLSGGNQQKVLLAKWLARSPGILIVDEPTRGVDVGSKADIYRILRELAAQGMALLVVSSDLPEVLALAHRIVVMSEGRVSGVLDAAQADEMTILHLAAPNAAIDRGAT